MQIHELNGYTGALDDAFIAADNGSDTGRKKIKDITDPLNARIDNIIAGGTAPSAAEVTDARLGANGITYASLGDAIRSQITDANNDVYNLGTLDIVNVPTNISWQLGYVRANGTTTASSLSQMALVPLLKGQTITVGTRNTNTGIISSTTQNTITVGDTFTPIIATSNVDQFETYSYTATEDINIVICVRKSEYSVKVTMKASLAQLSDVEAVFDNYSISELIPYNYIEGWYVYYSNTDKVAGGGTYSGDAALININDCGDVIKIGFDPDITYPGSQHVIMGMAGTTLPADGLFYYNSSELINGTNPSLAQSGFDLTTINDKYFTIEISKLVAQYPTIEAIAVNFPDTTYLLENYDAKPFKKVNFIRVANTVPAIVVAKDGSGDYTTISDAVANADNEDTIYIKDGEYKETVIINKYIHLVGQSKQGVILYQNIGDYDNCPLLITQGSVCNMTIKSLAPNDTSGLSDYAYAIHLDKNFASLSKYQKCEIYNCDIYSEVNDAIGAGTNYASEYDIHDCFIHVAHAPVKAASCGFKCHNGQNQTVGKVRLRNNIIITEDANGGSIYDILYHNGGISNIQPIELIQVGNVLKYYMNTVPTIFVPSGYNYGNSVSAMNTL